MYSLFQRLYDQTVVVKTSGGDAVTGRIRIVEEAMALVAEADRIDGGPA